jgi:hypothetical protein
VRSLLWLTTALTLVTVAHARPLDLRLARPPRAPGRAPARDLAGSPTVPSLHRRASYVAERSRRVEHDLLFFEHGYALGEPSEPARTGPCQAGCRATLDQLRERDRLRLYGPTPGGVTASERGAALFSAAVVAAAHAPPPLRRLLDGRWHLGPAILAGGGMGAGAGGSF